MEGRPEHEVVALPARTGVVCWNARDVSGCDESLHLAEEALDRVGASDRAELSELVGQVKAMRSQATGASQAESDRLYVLAMDKAEGGDFAGAHQGFEASLAASRSEGASPGVAINLLMSGQMLLALGRSGEARDR